MKVRKQRVSRGRAGFLCRGDDVCIEVVEEKLMRQKCTCEGQRSSRLRV